MPESDSMTSGDENCKTENHEDIYSVKTVEAIKRCLAQLHSKDDTIIFQLDSLLASRQGFHKDLERLELLRAHLNSQATRARSIRNGMFLTAVTTANRFSNSVHHLALESSRVKATLQMVEQVGELKTCVLGIIGSMGAPQDWEQAAFYLNRASKIPKEVIEGPFANKMIPTAEVPNLPDVALKHASESLCGLFLREFDKAVENSDGAKITRLFKLFPMIEKSEIGLNTYCRYVCEGVATRSRSNLRSNINGNQTSHFYVEAFTKLLEYIAQIINDHQSLVEHHYGTEMMVKVIERLQTEVDLQGGIILDTWADEHSIDRTLTDIRSYAYSFLVQSFLPSQKSLIEIPRSDSHSQGRVIEDESIDLKELYAMVEEMGTMLECWSLYTRFISNKSRSGTEVDLAEKSDESLLPEFLQRSALLRKVTDRLINPFNYLTTFFFRRTVEKAFQLDEQPSDLTLDLHKQLGSSPPYVTSAVEEIAFILNKVLRQTLQTSQVTVASSIIPNLSRVMSSDFVGMIQRKMQMIQRNLQDESYLKSAIQGPLSPEHMIIAFLVLINDLDVAADYVRRIIDTQSQLQPSFHSQGPHVTPTTTTPVISAATIFFPSMTESTVISSHLTSLITTFTTQTTTLLNEAILLLFTKVLQPRLRPILLNSFRDLDYSLTAEDLAAFDAEDPDFVGRRFQHGWDALTRPIGRIMTEGTFHNLLTTAVTYLAKLLEKRIWGYYERINELGAVRLQRDVNAIVNVVVGADSSGVNSSVGGGIGASTVRYGLRREFRRCLGILMVVSLEEEEWEDYRNDGGQEGEAGGDQDGLTADERERARRMVTGE